MRKLIFAFSLSLLLGILTYLKISESEFRLMSFDEPLQSLHESVQGKLVPQSWAQLTFKEKQAQQEFSALTSAISLGFWLWLVLFIIHRTQIFIVDFKAFLPLKK